MISELLFFDSSPAASENPYQPPANPTNVAGARPPHTRLGIASFVCSALAVLGVALYIGGIGFALLSAQRGKEQSESAVAIGVAVTGAIGSFGISGFGSLLGVASLFRTRKRRVLGIIGLATNGLIFGGYVVVLVLGMAAASSLQD